MRPEQHPASNSTARKAHAEATDPHGGCKVGQCKAKDQWRTVSCAGGGGDVDESQAQAGEVWQEADRVLLLCVEPGVTWGDFRGDRFAWDAPTIARPLRRLLDADGNLAAALAAQPAAPQPTEGGALTEAIALLNEAQGLIVSVGMNPDFGDMDHGLTTSQENASRLVSRACALIKQAAPQPTEGVELTEAERESLLADDLALSNLHADWGRAVLFAAVERILAARSQRPEGVTVTGALAPLVEVVTECEEHLRDAEFHQVWPAYEDNEAECSDECPGCCAIGLLDAAVRVIAEVSGDTEAGGDR